MYCVKCGKEAADGVMTNEGFVCNICKEAYDFLPCEGCGIYFPRYKLKELAGSLYCPTCYKALTPPAPPKPKIPAVKIGGGMKIKKKREKKKETAIKELEETEPSIVSEKAAKILRGRENEEDEEDEKGDEDKEKKIGAISSILLKLKDIIRGKKKEY